MRVVGFEVADDGQTMWSVIVTGLQPHQTINEAQAAIDAQARRCAETEAEVERLRKSSATPCQCAACQALREPPSLLIGHWSDCAVHNEPAQPAGSCDCGAEAAKRLLSDPNGICELDLRDALAAIAAESPPDDWKPYDDWNDYQGYGERDDPARVSGVDQSNSGDVHAHGYACGSWDTAKRLRALLSAPSQGAAYVAAGLALAEADDAQQTAHAALLAAEQEHGYQLMTSEAGRGEWRRLCQSDVSAAKALATARAAFVAAKAEGKGEAT